MQYLISEEEAGTSLLHWIRETLHPSSKMLKYLKYKPDGICVNGENRTVRYLLQTGDRVELSLTDDADASGIVPRDLPLKILYEDDQLVVPSKPAGMPTHPSRDHADDTVANALAFRYRTAGIPFVFRPVNRLDRNTSGLLLVARNKLAAGRLTEQLQAGTFEKRYLAVLDGELRESSGSICTCLHRTAKSIIVRETCPPTEPDAEPAHTEFRVLATVPGHTLVLARPITGRTHQLRVHFASVGHPITGDDLYGSPSPQINRQALHALFLSFPHPIRGERISLTAPLPPDLRTLVEALFPQFPTEFQTGKELYL